MSYWNFPQVELQSVRISTILRPNQFKTPVLDSWHSKVILKPLFPKFNCAGRPKSTNYVEGQKHFLDSWENLTGKSASILAILPGGTKPFPDPELVGLPLRPRTVSI